MIKMESTLRSSYARSRLPGFAGLLKGKSISSTERKRMSEYIKARAEEYRSEYAKSKFPSHQARVVSPPGYSYQYKYMRPTAPLASRSPSGRRY